MYTCKKDYATQTWHYVPSTKQVKSRSSSSKYCLELDPSTNNNLRLSNCDGDSQNQKFIFPDKFWT